ncbi:MAG: hypothetical protein N2319_03735 [Candidatus Kapabacteria bacterium]|nr:hypothetical protein [Candidatus Kapabacteria bacterium]
MEIKKKIELGIKHIFNKLIFSGSEPNVIDSPQKIFSGNLKILILRQDRIGDLIISSSIIRILKNILPNAKIDIVLSRKNYQAYLCIANNVNEIFIYTKKLIESFKLIFKLKKNSYDLVIDFFDNASTTSSLFLKLIKPKFSLGFDKENRNIYSHIVPLLDKTKNHIIDRISMILLPFGINPKEEKLDPFYPINEIKLADAKKEFDKNPEKILVAVNLAGSDRSKYIGKDNLLKLISMSQEKFQNVKLILFYTVDYLKDVEDLSKEIEVIKAPIFSDFDSYSNYLAACDIIITPDTSAVHLASAFKKPCIALYKGLRDTSDLPWFPYNTKYKALETNGDKISDIPAIEIFDALELFIKSSELNKSGDSF